MSASEKKYESLLPLEAKSGELATCPDEILGERLLLVPVSSTYVQNIFAEFTSEITTYMTPKPAKDISETQAFIDDSILRRKVGCDFVFAILKKDNRDFLGVCGLHCRGDLHNPELGLWLKKTAHGSKYGREAIHILKSWAEQNLVVEGFFYPVDEANIPSRKIPESYGGQVIRKEKTKTMDGSELDTLVYHILVDRRL